MTDSIFGSKWDWQPSSNKFTKITTIDAHTGGEPLRIIVSGLPPIQGRKALQKSRYFMEHYDYIRTGLLLEPRGHANMYGAILTTSADPAVDLGCFFMTTDGHNTMCGHAALAITKVVIESGVIKKEGPSPEITISVPTGLVCARAVLAENGEVKHSSFRNVPSFVYLQDQNVDVVGIGTAQFGLTFGGAFYAIVDAEALNLDLTLDSYSRIVDYGREIKKKVMEECKIEHPYEPDLSFLYGVIFTGRASGSKNHSRNVTVFEDGGVHRPSTGTGLSARAALLYSKGQLNLMRT